MVRFLVSLLSLLLLFVFVLPNPVQAGSAIGNAVDSVIIFSRNVAHEVDIGNETEDTAAARRASAIDTNDTSGGRDWVYPRGGVASGDGTTADIGDDRLLLGLRSPSVRAPAGALASEAALRRDSARAPRQYRRRAASSDHLRRRYDTHAGNYEANIVVFARMAGVT